MSRNDERGFTTIWVIGLMMMIIFIGFAVIDAWRVYATQRQLAARADAAAAAGAQAVDVAEYSASGKIRLIADSTDQSAFVLARSRITADTGMPPDGVSLAPSCPAAPQDPKIPIACVEVLNPPAAESTIKVTITRKVHFTVFALLGTPDQTVSASSTATAR